MSDSVSIIARTADQTRKAAVSLPLQTTVSQVLEQAQQQWNLPNDHDYAARLERTNEQLDSASDLASAGVQNDDVIEIFPILKAG